MDLLKDTRLLLSKARKEMSLAEIAEACGGVVKPDWLKKFCYGKERSHTLNRVQALHDFLKSRKSNASQSN